MKAVSGCRGCADPVIGNYRRIIKKDKKKKKTPNHPIRRGHDAHRESHQTKKGKNHLRNRDSSSNCDEESNDGLDEDDHDKDGHGSDDEDEEDDHDVGGNGHHERYPDSLPVLLTWYHSHQFLANQGL